MLKFKSTFVATNRSNGFTVKLNSSDISGRHRTLINTTTTIIKVGLALMIGQHLYQIQWLDRLLVCLPHSNSQVALMCFGGVALKGGGGIFRFESFQIPAQIARLAKRTYLAFYSLWLVLIVNNLFQELHDHIQPCLWELSLSLHPLSLSPLLSLSLSPSPPLFLWTSRRANPGLR